MSIEETCVSCGSGIDNSTFELLVSTFFNATVSNFTLVLNRKEISTKLVVKITKDLKRKINASI